MAALLVFLALAFAAVSCQEGPHLTDREILEVVYREAGGDGWEDQYRLNWCSATGIGQWKGVATDGDGRVTSLNVRGSGRIAGEISGLDCLKELTVFLDNTGLDGLEDCIPGSIAELPQLERLSFTVIGSDCALPDIKKIKTLRELRINVRDVVPMPDLSGLEKLEEIEISGCCGPVPPGIYGIPALRSIKISSPRLEAGISEDVAALVNLERLCLDRTSAVEGCIPLPGGLFGLTNLRDLFLRRMASSGTIPPSVGDMSSLKSFVCIDCGLAGGIPSGVGRLKGLRVLEIYDNPELGGVIPPEIGGLTELRDLWLYGDGIGGEIPAELGRLVNLESLQLQNNALTGKIPETLGRCRDLGKGYFVNFSRNRLDAGVPKSVRELGYFDRFVF